MLENPRRPIAKWHTLKNITCEQWIFYEPHSSFSGLKTTKPNRISVKLCFFSAEKSSRLERFVPKRGNLSKALSVDASDARHKIFKLKKNKSVDDRQELDYTVSSGVINNLLQYIFLLTDHWPRPISSVSLFILCFSSVYIILSYSSYSPFFQKSGRLIISGVREQWINRLAENKEKIGSKSYFYIFSFLQAIWAMCWVWGVRPAASRTSVMLSGSHNTRKIKKYQKHSMSPQIRSWQNKKMQLLDWARAESCDWPVSDDGSALLFVLSDMKCSFLTWTRVAGGVYFKRIWHK